jgi:hypothetical protein
MLLCAFSFSLSPSSTPNITNSSTPQKIPPRLPQMPVEHARSLFKLSEVLLQDSCDSEEAKLLRDEAELYLLRREPQVVEFGREEDYDR